MNAHRNPAPVRGMVFAPLPPAPEGGDPADPGDLDQEKGLPGEAPPTAFSEAADAIAEAASKLYGVASWKVGDGLSGADKLSLWQLCLVQAQELWRECRAQFGVPPLAAALGLGPAAPGWERRVRAVGPQDTIGFSYVSGNPRDRQLAQAAADGSNGAEGDWVKAQPGPQSQAERVAAMAEFLGDVDVAVWHQLRRVMDQRISDRASRNARGVKAGG